MATCANCIHHSLCDYNTNISGAGKVRLVYAEGADVKCSFFENRADVAPKSEVAREIFEEFESILQKEIATYEALYNETYDPRFKQEYVCAQNALEWSLIKITEHKKEIHGG